MQRITYKEKHYSNMDIKIIDEIAHKLKKDAVGVLPTDTIYGLLGSALNRKVVERIYKLRKRSSNKPMIILISSLDDLEKFNITLDEKTKFFLRKNWPNPLSVVLPCPNPQFEYLHKGTNTLAFRMPENLNLLKLLSVSGPLVAPSANFEGEKPAENIDQAKKYFGEDIDFYVDGGILKSFPSTLIKIEDGKIITLRQGSFKLKENQIT